MSQVFHPPLLIVSIGIDIGLNKFYSDCGGWLPVGIHFAHGSRRFRNGSSNGAVTITRGKQVAKFCYLPKGREGREKEIHNGQPFASPSP